MTTHPIAPTTDTTDIGYEQYLNRGRQLRSQAVRKAWCALVARLKHRSGRSHDKQRTPNIEPAGACA